MSELVYLSACFFNHNSILLSHVYTNIFPNKEQLKIIHGLLGRIWREGIRKVKRQKHVLCFSISLSNSGLKYKLGKLYRFKQLVEIEHTAEKLINGRVYHKVPKRMIKKIKEHQRINLDDNGDIATDDDAVSVVSTDTIDFIKENPDKLIIGQPDEFDEIAPEEMKEEYLKKLFDKEIKRAQEKKEKEKLKIKKEEMGNERNKVNTTSESGRGGEKKKKITIARSQEYVNDTTVETSSNPNIEEAIQTNPKDAIVDMEECKAKPEHYMTIEMLENLTMLKSIGYVEEGNYYIVEDKIMLVKPCAYAIGDYLTNRQGMYQDKFGWHCRHERIHNSTWSMSH